MTRIRFIEAGGHRYAPDEVSEINELRCDGCGQFVAEPEAATLEGRLFVPDEMSFRSYLNLLHFHPACVPECLREARP